jgi:triphosphatase
MSTSAPSATTPPGRNDGREVEWQLTCTDLKSVRRWLAEHGTIDGLVLEPRSTLQIFDTYLDTHDWRIHRAGFALRIRSGCGKPQATLKSLHSASGEVADRVELNETLENSASEAILQSDGPVGARVQAVSGASALLPLFELRTSRQRFAIRKEAEVQQLGEIALDETTISPPHGAPRTSLQRVEVEAHTDSYGPLHSLVKSLRSECALEAAADTKYSYSLKTVGLAPPAPELPASEVDVSPTMAAVAEASVRRYWSAWQRHELGARLGEDPEELHAVRVAGRRLDAILRQFRSSLPAPLLKIRPTLKTVLRALGQARDLDVALSEQDSFSRELPKSDRAGLEPLKQHLLTERARVHERMLRVLDSIWVRKNLREFAAALAAPAAPSPHPPPELALRAAPELIGRRYRKLRKRAERLDADSSMDEFHEVRGQVKKLRYALEAVADLYGKPADEMLRALRRWQEKLGMQQDAAVASIRLITLASAPPPGIPPETLFLMGRLAQQQCGAALRARKRHTKSYKKIRGTWKTLRLKFRDSAARSAPRLVDTGP